MTKVNDDTRLQ